MMKSILLVTLILASFGSFAQSVEVDKSPSTKMTPVVNLIDQEVESIAKQNVDQQKLKPVAVTQLKLNARNQDQALMERKRKGPDQPSKHVPVD